MSLPEIADKEEWRAARIDLLAEEKAMTRARDPSPWCHGRPSRRSRSTRPNVFHTYSVYARGTEWLGGAYAFLDLTALGRQEDWEEPKGRAASMRDARPDFNAE